MAKNKFADQARAFAEKVRLRQEAIFKESAQAIIEEANTPEGKGGKMPVDVGFLMNSVAASTAGMPSGQSVPTPGAVYSGPVNGDPGLIFAGMSLGQKVWVGWTAAYALRMEHGFFGPDKLGRVYEQAGKGFARSAAQRWDFIVAEVTAKVKKEIP